MFGKEAIQIEEEQEDEEEAQEEIAMEETRKMLRCIRNGKASNRDENNKMNREKRKNYLLQIFKEARISAKMPEDWKTT